MGSVVLKKKDSTRYKKIADEFLAWLEKNPAADHRRIFDTFDAYCDTAALNEMMEHEEIELAENG